MKTITIRQPWASMIAHGLKRIETRTHARFAGLVGHKIAIHAGKYLPADLSQSACPTGAVVCTARVAAVGWLADTDRNRVRACCEVAGRYGLLLADLDVLPRPIPARGKQGIWDWEPK